MCLDFGTAFCKAAVRKADGEPPILLELGRLAGDPGSAGGLPVLSSLFVSSSGLVSFGHHAVEAWGRQRPVSIQRIESMKRWLSEDPMDEFDHLPVSGTCLPEGEQLLKIDALILFLSYLSNLTGLSLKEHDLSRHVRRRFSRPVWNGTRGEWVDRTMRHLLGVAQVVADSIPERCWQSGVQLADAKTLVAEAKQVFIPPWLIHQKRALEPIAAGIAALTSKENTRGLALVVDVGAGTSDFAAFITVQPDSANSIQRAIPSGVPCSIPIAGDYLDGILRDALLGMLPQDRLSDAVRLEAQGNSRLWKETLFLTGRLDPVYSGGLRGPSIRTSDFASISGVREFAEELRRTTGRVLHSVQNAIDIMYRSPTNPSEAITLVPTGGGAQLPMVRELMQVAPKSGGRDIRVVMGNPAPQWFARAYGNQEDLFGRMAVAIGGVSEEYPEEDELAPLPSVIHRGRI